MTGERHALEPDRVLVTVLFTDIVESTKRAAEIGDRRWRDLLDSHNVLMHTEIDRSEDVPSKARVTDFWQRLMGQLAPSIVHLRWPKEMRQLGIEIRSGLHTGEVELIGGDVGGIAVHTAARVLANANANEVWISRTVRVAVQVLRARDLQP
jgi:class 3 adenylate cyclase